MICFEDDDGLRIDLQLHEASAVVNIKSDRAGYGVLLEVPKEDEVRLDEALGLAAFRDAFGLGTLLGWTGDASLACANGWQRVGCSATSPPTVISLYVLMRAVFRFVLSLIDLICLCSSYIPQ